MAEEENAEEEFILPPIWTADGNEECFRKWRENNPIQNGQVLVANNSSDPMNYFWDGYRSGFATIGVLPHPAVYRLVEDTKIEIEKNLEEGQEQPPGTPIERFHLRSWILDTGSAHAITMGFRVCTTLKSVNFCQMTMSDEAFAALLWCLKDTNVDTLALDFCLQPDQLNTEDSLLFFSEPTEGEEPAEPEEGEEPLPPPRRISVFTIPLLEGSKVSTLSFRGNGIGDRHMRDITEELKKNHTLTGLNLFSNKIGDEGATCMAETIKTNDKIRYISLGQNKIGDAGATVFADALNKYEAPGNLVEEVEQLKAEHEKKMGEHATAVAQATKMKKEPPPEPPAPFIPTLIEVDGKQYCEGNRTLACLDLLSNLITDTGAGSIVEMLGENKTLQRITLDMNNISEKMGMALVDAMVVPPPPEEEEQNEDQEASAPQTADATRPPSRAK